MRRSFIITSTDLSNNGLIYENMEERKTNTMILRVQDTKLEPILCEQLYTLILDYADDISNDIAIPSDYTTLIEDYIQPYLMVEIEKKITYYNTSEITNKTTGRNNDEHISANDKSQNDVLRNDLNSDIVTYRNRLVQYLKDNTDLYPLYLECDCDEVQEGKNNSYSNRIGFTSLI